MKENPPILSYFITGIGTGIGKTLVSAILAEALDADYWKPVQAGIAEGTDSQWVESVLSGREGRVFPERYKLQMAASPHIAAKKEGIHIEKEEILKAYQGYSNRSSPSGRKIPLLIEGAGGLLAPISANDFVIDLVSMLRVPAILVSRNYLGSINHSLLTAACCRSRGLPVAGWVFNDQYLDYEKDIVGWTSIPKIASIPYCERPGREFVRSQADNLRESLMQIL